VPKVEALMAYLAQVVAKENLVPGGFGWTMLEAHKAGRIPVEGAIGLLAGYVVAAFDTTISALSSGVWLLARHPEQWEALRADPSLVPSAFNEIVRIESPIQVFSRVTTREVDLGEGVVLPAGARVLHSYGAANRDERHFPDPDRFDVRRNPADHLGFGFGNHGCAGQGLARLEAHAVLRALAERVRHIALDGEPVRALNNITRGFSAPPGRRRTGPARRRARSVDPPVRLELHARRLQRPAACRRILALIGTDAGPSSSRRRHAALGTPPLTVSAPPSHSGTARNAQPPRSRGSPGTRHAQLAATSAVRCPTASSAASQPSSDPTLRSPRPCPVRRR